MVIKEIYVGTPINEQGISTNNLEKFIVVSSLIGVIGLGLYPEIIMGAINSAAIAVRIN